MDDDFIVDGVNLSDFGMRIQNPKGIVSAARLREEAAREAVVAARRTVRYTTAALLLTALFCVSLGSLYLLVFTGLIMQILAAVLIVAGTGVLLNVLAVTIRERLARQ